MKGGLITGQVSRHVAPQVGRQPDSLEIVEELAVIAAEARETDKALQKILKQIGI